MVGGDAGRGKYAGRRRKWASGGKREEPAFIPSAGGGNPQNLTERKSAERKPVGLGAGRRCSVKDNTFGEKEDHPGCRV